MKKISLSMLAASTLLFGFQYDYETTEFQTYVTNQTVVNEVVSDTAMVDFATSDKTVGVTAQYIYAGDVSILNIPLSLNIGSNFGLDAMLPLIKIKNSSTGDDNTGIGDISVGGNFHFGMPSDVSGINVTSLRYKTTTGDDTKGLGSGYDAYTLSHRITKNIGDRFQANGLLSYTLNDEKISGNSYLVMAGGSMPCLFWDKVRTHAKITYFGVEALSGFGEVKTADFWLGWNSDKIAQGIPLGIGVKIPLINELDGKEKNKTVLFYLSASSFF
ncbi:hypothetical protein KKG72_04360 [bacterium]|nr:hypothetical protein [bacterium]MBU1994329.1 hypothetical protein [bacterium]